MDIGHPGCAVSSFTWTLSRRFRVLIQAVFDLISSRNNTLCAKLERMNAKSNTTEKHRSN